MSFSALGWGMGDITNAAKVIWTLLKHLDSKKGTRQKHKRSLDYLRSYLLPTLRLIPRYLKDIESQRNHPCWEEWNVSLNVMKHSWSKFNDYLQSRTGLLPENARDQPSIGVIPWTWDEVTGQIDNLRRELQDGLNDIDRLILWEISQKFGLVLPRLDAMFERIDRYDECVSTYRQDVQDALYFIRTNKQDFKSLKDLFNGNMAELAERLTQSQMETEAVNMQLKAMSERLDRLLTQLWEQRVNCTSKAERKYLDQLRKEARKQAASITRLRNTVEDTLGTTAEVLNVLDKVDVRKDILQRASIAMTDVSDVLKKTVPLLERLYDSLKQGPGSVDVKKLRFIGRKQKQKNEQTEVAVVVQDGGTFQKDPYFVEKREQGEARRVVPDLEDDGDIDIDVADDDNESLPTILEESSESTLSHESGDRTSSETMSTWTTTTLPTPVSPSSSTCSCSTFLLDPFDHYQQFLTPLFSRDTAPPPIPRKSSARRRSRRDSAEASSSATPSPTLTLTLSHPPSPSRSPPPPPPSLSPPNANFPPRPNSAPPAIPTSSPSSSSSSTSSPSTLPLPSPTSPVPLPLAPRRPCSSSPSSPSSTRYSSFSSETTTKRESAMSLIADLEQRYTLAVAMAAAEGELTPPTTPRGE